MIGNEEIKEYLCHCAKHNTMSQSYLFIGTEGIGKFLMAKEFAKKILCLEQDKKKDCACKSCACFEGGNHPDYFVIGENKEAIKIEQIREITSKILEPPILAQKKVYIINHCDKMTIEAQNCLLKTLEEPPQFAIIVLITANENALLNTIKSRCMTIKFKPIAKDELKKYAMDKLGMTQMTENLLESFNGSIGKAIAQKENQERFLKIEQIIHDLEKQDMLSMMKQAQVLYDKENIREILEYMMICCHTKARENKKYIDCIEKINHAIRAVTKKLQF